MGASPLTVFSLVSWKEGSSQTTVQGGFCLCSAHCSVLLRKAPAEGCGQRARGRQGLVSFLPHPRRLCIPFRLHWRPDWHLHTCLLAG